MAKGSIKNSRARRAIEHRGEYLSLIDIAIAQGVSRKSLGKIPKNKKGGRQSVQDDSSKDEPSSPPPEPEVDEVGSITESIDCEDQASGCEACRYTPDACCKSAIACRPNSYPGLLEDPQALAVVGSENGSYESICKLMRAGLRCADRVFMMTPWGNYVIFRATDNSERKLYFLFDGCTCNVNRFRYMDLTKGTAGLLYFDDLHKVVQYIIQSREAKDSVRKMRRSIVDDICKEFCEYGSKRHANC